MHPLENFARDLRHAVRQLTRSRGFALMAVLTLALGIARTLPSSASSKPCSCARSLISTLNGLSWSGKLTPPIATQALISTPIANSWFGSNTTSASRRSQPSRGQLAPGRYCGWANQSMCSLSPPASTSFPCSAAAQIGRTFAPRDLETGCTVVLAYNFWTHKLGAPADIVGRSLSFRNSSCIVAGVMPKTFSFYPVATDAWSLITPGGEFAQKPWTSMTGVFGLLRPGVTRAAAESELTAIQASVYCLRRPPTSKSCAPWLPTSSTCNRTSLGSPAAICARACGFS